MHRISLTYTTVNHAIFYGNVLFNYYIIFLAKCDSPLSEDSRGLVIADYSRPALEGTNVSFSCPPGLVLTGSSRATCMGNGEWKPDPSHVRCIGKDYAHLSVFQVVHVSGTHTWYTLTHTC